MYLIKRVKQTNLLRVHWSQWKVKTICHRFQWVEEKKNSMEVSRNGRVQGPEFLGYGSFFSSFSSKLLPWRIKEWIYCLFLFLWSNWNSSTVSFKQYFQPDWRQLEQQRFIRRLIWRRRRESDSWGRAAQHRNDGKGEWVDEDAVLWF
jgi:hypothetical protein